MLLNRAYTRIQLLLVIALVSLLSVIVGLMVSQSLRAYYIAKSITPVINQSRFVLFDIEKEIRGIDPNAIITASSAEFVGFQTGSNEVLTLNEQYVLAVSQYIEPNSLRFYYLNNKALPAKDSSEIAYIGITLTVMAKDAFGDSRRIPVRKTVYLRQ